MSNRRNGITNFLAVGGAVLLTGAGVATAVYALTLESDKSESTVHTSKTQQKKTPRLGEAKRAAAVIVYGNNGFEKTTYTVKAGDVVRVKNDSSVEFYFTTGDHHNHDIHSPLNLGVITPGKSKRFVAPSVGTYGFHNHDNETEAGELIVQ